MLTAIVGTNWGDEGKGRMVDLLSEKYDVVVRYQGGNNAGHTVINEKGKFIMNLMPSGILRDETANVLGPGIVIDLEHLYGEAERLREAGIEITPKHLKISDRATICMPYHKLLDGLEEDRLGDKKFGSTRRGISPVYADKYMKKTIRMGDLLHWDTLRERLGGILEWKNLTVERGYGHAPVELDEIMAWLEKYGKPFTPYVCNTTEFLSGAIKEGKSVIFEAQLGALRDIDFGIYPYTSASTTLAAYAPIGAGIPFAKLDESIGIMKAYSSCVGEGPFTCELFGDEAHALREAGGEYGAATGRPRRVGGFDVVASRYGAKMQGCSYIALTKLERKAHRRLPRRHRRAGGRKARVRDAPGLLLRYLPLPHEGGSAERGAGLYPLYRGQGRLPDQVRLRRRRARRLYHDVLNIPATEQGKTGPKGPFFLVAPRFS